MVMNNDTITLPYSNKPIRVLFLLMVLCCSFLQAQEPSSFKWKNRLILILVSDITEDVYIKQITELNAHIKGLNERKLLVYHIQHNRYKIGLEAYKWQQSKQLYHQYKKSKSPFEIILLGLDGGNKLQSTTFLSCKDLFDTIDAMPMRTREKQ